MPKNRIFSEDELEKFRQDGFIVVRNLLDMGEMRDLIGWTGEMENYPEEPGKYMMYFEKSLTKMGERILSRIENFCAYHRGFSDVINGPKMLGACSELFDEIAVLFKEKINF